MATHHDGPYPEANQVPSWAPAAPIPPAAPKPHRAIDDTLTTYEANNAHLGRLVSRVESMHERISGNTQSTQLGEAKRAPDQSLPAKGHMARLQDAGQRYEEHLKRLDELLTELGELV